VGQYVWLTLKGKNANGEQHDLSLWLQPSDVSVNARWIADGFIDKPVPYNYLKSLGHNTELRIEFKASLSKSQEESTAQAFVVRTYTVKSTPTITWLRGSPSGQDIAPDGFTRETSVTLSGTASKGQQVDVLDGEDTKGQPIADAVTGIWTQTIDELSVARHSLTARAMDAGGATSKAWVFTVIGELSIDRQQMNLNGLSVKMPDWPKTGEDSIGNTQVRQPTGGLAPYFYASSNQDIASVNTEGKVTGNRNGVVTITVSDSAGAAVSYTVAVTNVYRLRIHEQHVTALQAVEWKDSLADSSIFHDAHVYDLHRVYGNPLPYQDVLWLCVSSGCNPPNFPYFLDHIGIGCRNGLLEYSAVCIQLS